MEASSSAQRRMALLEQAERLARIGSWEWTLDTGELIWSDNAFRLLGIEPGAVEPSLELLGERTHPEDRDRFNREADKVARGAGSQEFDYRVVLPGGDVRHLRSITVAKDETGDGRTRVIGCVQDVTEQLRAEQEIAAHVAVSEALTEWDSVEQGAVRLLQRLAEALGYVSGSLWVPDGSTMAIAASWHRADRDLAEFEAAGRQLRVRRGAGLVGRAWAAGAPVSMTDLGGNTSFLRRGHAQAAHLRSALAFPAIRGEEVLAVLELFSADELQPGERLMRTLTGIAHELGGFLAHRRGALVPATLTPRELEVLQLAAHGHSGPKIAERLVVSPSTVKTHFEHIYEKLGVPDRSAAVARAIREGLIE